MTEIEALQKENTQLFESLQRYKKECEERVDLVKAVLAIRKETKKLRKAIEQHNRQVGNIIDAISFGFPD
jgi:hypothetical protein